MKTCDRSVCGQQNPQSLDSFYKNKSRNDGYSNYCKSCVKETYELDKDNRISKQSVYYFNHLEERSKYNKKYRVYNRSNNRKYGLKKKFNLSLEEYKTFLIKQDNKCAICKNEETSMDNRNHLPKHMAVDHCHKTNKIRGLLCSSCNLGLGKFKDNVEVLNNAIEYLKDKVL